jgi:DNA mismatch endonuclease (patch repair protein)
MASISGKETKPEISVRSFLFRAGFRFRKNVKTLPGKPDIVLPKHRTVIFVHGCFWHGHKCRASKTSKTRKEFWQQKIGSNISRDCSNQEKLIEQGWRVMVVWECEIRTKALFVHEMNGLQRKIRNFRG